MDLHRHSRSSPARTVLFAGALCFALAGCGRSAAPDDAVGPLPGTALRDPRLARCFAESPYLAVGAGLDAPGRIEMDAPPGREPAGACQGNTQFRFGSGIYDITGVVANTSGQGWENATQVFRGIHTRQHARAFAVESPCNGQRVMFVSADLGMMFGSIREYVLSAIAADPALAAAYGPDNVMLSVTHTHQAPGGYEHFLAWNLFHYGFDRQNFEAIARGIVEAIKRAHANLQAHADAGSIGLAIGELLNANVNRSRVAFDLNAEPERRAFLNERGEAVDTDKRVVQINLVRRDGSPVGVVNWFGVHSTILGPDLSLVGSDMKGYASLGFERIMKTDYAAPAGSDTFVAAFAQADEGDSSPNIFIRERPFPDPARGGGADAYESNAISGTKHLVKALELYGEGRPLSGPVDYRFFHVKLDAVTITDPVVLDGLHHPAELDADPKRTCTAAFGPSTLAGAEDGPVVLTEGLSCQTNPDLLAQAQSDLQTLVAGLQGHFPTHSIPGQLVSTAVFCNLRELPGLTGADFSCQAEKPIALVLGPPVDAQPDITPFQILRLGNLAVVGIPWEVTTMAARRIRKTILDVLAPVGVDTVVVAGLVNDYVDYLTTREEYSAQHYEGASNIFGPWSLAAVQQELRKLALSMREQAPPPAGPAYRDGNPILIRPPYNPSDLPGAGGNFGDVVADVPATARPGETVVFVVQAGHPRNDLKTQSSYVFAERRDRAGRWQVVARDRDPELWFEWRPDEPSTVPLDAPATGSSTAAAIWHIPRDTPNGQYRLRIEGVAQTGPAAAVPYDTASGVVTVDGPQADCP